jgi:hypothetical protein
MNPTATSSKPGATGSQSLFNGAFKTGFETKEYEQPEAVNDSVPDSQEYRKTISTNWAEFYSLKTEDINPQSPERVINPTEISQMRVEVQQAENTPTVEKTESQADLRPISAIEDQKGDGSALEEIWSHLEPAKKLKGAAKNLFGGLSIFGELFMDTVKFFTPKKAEKVETDPEKAKAAAEKKAEKQRKQGNRNTFLQALMAHASAVVSPDAARMETQEKANINITAKIGNEAYKGIKDSFGRITVYAASLFETAQMDQEKHAKKQEKEAKMQSAGGRGPDLNMDKVAEGGFLSSTGGQGAG